MRTDGYMNYVLLKLQNVDVAIADRKVLTNISMAIRHSELHVIIGPNGAGKTALLSSIVGLPNYRIINGYVIFNNENITSLPFYERVKRGLILAYQTPPLFRGIKVYEVINSLLEKFKVDHSYERRLREVLNIEEFINRDLFFGMSGGERKRLETYLTLVCKPVLALLDEPDSGVDIDSISNIIEAIKIALYEGVTLLIVTHSLYTLEKLQNILSMIHVLYNGKMYSGLYDNIVPLIVKYGFEGIHKLYHEGKIFE